MVSLKLENENLKIKVESISFIMKMESLEKENKDVKKQNTKNKNDFKKRQNSDSKNTRKKPVGKRHRQKSFERRNH